MAKEKETVPAALLTLTIGIAVAGISFWVGQNSNLLPEQISGQAPLVDNLFKIMLTISTALFLLVEGAIVYAMIKFRNKEGDETDGPPTEGNFSLEIFWTAIPSFIVIALGLYSVQVYNQMGGFEANGGMAMAHRHHPALAQLASLPGTSGLIAQGTEETTPGNHYGIGGQPKLGQPDPEIEVNVTGLQYAWLFNYPNSGITSGELHIPINTDVQLNITAQDVIHAFWLPQFRLKQDALPGETTRLRFVATQTGTYPVVCAELCGSYHGAMRTQVIVHSEEDYVNWVKENQIAQNPQSDRALAVNPQTMTDSEYLAPYAEELGIEPEILDQLHS
ncbi:MAG: cytochrome c oxidase subunit II [Cyanobacteriota bacterium]|nr:cytochrome c oxidase subunit II [Cyanobacteriota bacterium]